MAVYTSNIIIYTGTNLEQSYILEDDAGLMNLTDYTVISKMKRHPTSSSSTIFTSAVTSATAGRIKISLSPEQTILLKPGKYVYDIILYKNGLGTRVIEGEVFVKKSVTR
jgi:hypothetical protein